MTVLPAFGRNIPGLFILGPGHYLLGLGNQPLCRSRVGIQHYVLNAPEQRRLNVVIYLKHARIDYAHVQARLDGVVEEDGVHCLPDLVVASE